VTSAAPAEKRRLTLDLTPVRRSRPFRNLLIGDAVSVIGTQVTAVAVPLQVYEQTRSAAAVGLVGIAGLIPLIVFGLYGGAVADAVDRRRLVLITTSSQAVLSAILLSQAIAGVGWTWLLYLIVAVQAGLFALDSPARQAFVPRLVDQELLPSANALRQVEFNVGMAGGPLLAGVIVAAFGFGAAYGLDAVSFGASLWAVASLPSMAPEGGGRRAGLASVIEGLQFLRTRRVLMLTFVVDIIAMVFGMPRSLFAPLSDHVFGGGEAAAGALYAAIPAGALLGALFGGWFGRIHKQGIAVIAAIGAWGVCIIGFGRTSHLWVALVLLAGAGAADMISAVFRTAILQTAAPDDMRGRLGGVFIVVVAGGPRLGDGRSGAFASWFGLQEAVVIGGVLVIGLTAVVALLVPRFLAYDSRHPFD
jgi:MFS family permease